MSTVNRNRSRDMNKIGQICKLFGKCKTSKKGEISKMLLSLNNKERHLLSELCFNLIHNISFANFSPSKLQKVIGIMKPHRSDFEFLAQKTGSARKKKEIIVKQTGTGIFTALLSVVLPALISLIAK